MILYLKKPQLKTIDVDISSLEEYYRSRRGGYVSYKLPESILNQVYEVFKIELQDYIEGAFIQVIDPLFNNNIHRDPRIYAINYILDQGGTNVETCFYDKSSNEEKYVFPLHQWHLIRTDGLHCVKNVVTERKSISISFKNNISFDKLLEIVE